MIAVLIACGSNQLEIPCRVFESLEQGKEACDALLGQEGKLTKGGGYIYTAYLDDDKDTDEEISKKLFTSHYYGCGGPGPFYLMEVEPDTKFVPFDLD
jgi:hypothetical protein